MANTKKTKTGLVLTGGGARSAYHAGVLLALNDLMKHSGQKLHFDIISGISGGAINGTYLASKAENFTEACEGLKDNWANISIEQLLDVKGSEIFSKAGKLILQLGGGGLFNFNPTTNLVDTKPLLKYLRKKINFRKIDENIDSGILSGVGVSATNYGTGSAVTFYDGPESIVPWSRSHYTSQRARLKLEHVIASASIPILFPPAKIHHSYYGDGAIRMKYPISPAIHMGADRVIAIGLRKTRPPMETLKLNQNFVMKKVQLSDILGVVFHSLFLDGLESDIERMERVNLYIGILQSQKGLQNPDNLKVIPVLSIQPSEDLGEMAMDALKKLPAVFRHFLRGLGIDETKGGDMLSYLAFEKNYAQRMIELGYEDVFEQRDAILEWFGLQKLSADLNV
jgi:NTE family protein